MPSLVTRTSEYLPLLSGINLQACHPMQSLSSLSSYPIVEHLPPSGTGEARMHKGKATVEGLKLVLHCVLGGLVKGKKKKEPWELIPSGVVGLQAVRPHEGANMEVAAGPQLVLVIQLG